jgi:hypothetical protein
MSEREELQAAKAELRRKKNILRVANERHDQLLGLSSPDPREVLEAESGVAKAKLGVAEAELSVAKAELSVAKAKEDTPERQLEIAKGEWDVAKAVYDVAEAKGSGQSRLEFLQGEIAAKQATCTRLEGQLSFLDFCAPHVSSVLA